VSLLIKKFPSAFSYFLFIRFKYYLQHPVIVVCLPEDRGLRGGGQFKGAFWTSESKGQKRGQQSEYFELKYDFSAQQFFKNLKKIIGN